jgi:hypothetical protein
MIQHEARKHFKVTPCTNPTHSFKIGRMMGQWRVANDIWVTITDKGQEMTHWFRFGKLRDQDGETIYELVVWKLSVVWGFL